MAGRIYRTEGIVLKTFPSGEGDLLVSLLTRDGTKLRAMAWGARKSTSKKIGHLEPLTRVDLALARGRDLDSISQAQGLESFSSLKASLETTSKAIYLAELVEAFAIEGGSNVPLYSLFLNALRFLEEYPRIELTLPFFELHLLKVSGFMPQLYRCVECREKVVPGEHRFSVDLGGVLCAKCVPLGVRIASLSLQALKVLRFMDRNDLSELVRLRASSFLCEEVASPLDDAVRYWLDREVRSKAFMDHLKQRERESLRA